jgi:hypothetical protein
MTQAMYAHMIKIKIKKIKVKTRRKLNLVNTMRLGFP